MYLVDSGLFVARWIPKNKHVVHFVNVPLSELQLDFVHVSEMKEFAKQLHYCLCIFQPEIVTAFVHVFTYVFDCLHGVIIFNVYLCIKCF